MYKKVLVSSYENGYLINSRKSGKKKGKQFMNLSLTGKKAVVTGGGRGLCRSIAQAYLDAGAEVVIVGSSARTEEAAKEMASRHRPAAAVIGDLSEPECIPEIYAECLRILGGRIDILVNGAGSQFRCPAETFPYEQWERILKLNLSAAFRMSQLAGRDMLAQGYGRIINIASMTSFFGSEQIPAYSASKGGIAQLTKALSNEWAKRGVLVNAIAPGYMKTSLTETIKTTNPSQYEQITQRIPAGRWGTGEDLQGISVLLASDAASYISGAVIPVDGGYLGK